MLFVGTKRQARETIQKAAERCGMPYVADRWLGGTLTNFRTIRDRLERLEELEKIIAGEEINTYSKKMQSTLNREYRKIYHNLHGIRTMSRLPECLVVVDPKKEKNAVKEARKLGIATVALIDTDCDPDLVDLPIPGNDDSMRSIELVVNMLADAIGAAQGPGDDGPAASQRRRRARRRKSPRDVCNPDLLISRRGAEAQRIRERICLAFSASSSASLRLCERHSDVGVRDQCPKLPQPW